MKEKIYPSSKNFRCMTNKDFEPVCQISHEWTNSQGLGYVKDQAFMKYWFVGLSRYCIHSNLGSKYSKTA